ncbi:hypothetical protein C6A85_05475, partial [Mycobacterium sp. ITM-2017-0098]
MYPMLCSVRNRFQTTPAIVTYRTTAPRTPTRASARGAVVLYVTMAGVVWNLFLTEHSMGYTPANLLLHVV